MISSARKPQSQYCGSAGDGLHPDPEQLRGCAQRRTDHHRRRDEGAARIGDIGQPGEQDTDPAEGHEPEGHQQRVPAKSIGHRDSSQAKEATIPSTKSGCSGGGAPVSSNARTADQHRGDEEERGHQQAQHADRIRPSPTAHAGTSWKLDDYARRRCPTPWTRVDLQLASPRHAQAEPIEPAALRLGHQPPPSSGSSAASCSTPLASREPGSVACDPPASRSVPPPPSVQAARAVAAARLEVDSMAVTHSVPADLVGVPPGYASARDAGTHHHAAGRPDCHAQATRAAERDLFAMLDQDR